MIQSIRLRRRVQNERVYFCSGIIHVLRTIEEAIVYLLVDRFLLTNKQNGTARVSDPFLINTQNSVFRSSGKFFYYHTIPTKKPLLRRGLRLYLKNSTTQKHPPCAGLFCLIFSL